MNKQLNLDICKAFDLIDGDKDGFIRLYELKVFLANYGFFGTDREL